MKTKETRGITLIALVVTIIVLLILAGISISMLAGQNGILNRAAEAKEKTEIATMNEQRKLAQSEAMMNDSIEQEYNGVKIPKKCAPTKIKGESTIDEGMVIIDADGNEYVWIEVPKSIYVDSKYTKKNNNKEVKEKNDYLGIYNILNAYANDYREGAEGDGRYWKDEYYNGCETETLSKDAEKSYNDLYNTMLSSVFINGGFWVGRYEVGDFNSTKNNVVRNEKTGITNTPVVKADQIPYNYVTCNEAQKISLRFQYDDVNVSLPFGIQFDLICKFIEKNKEKQLINKDSTVWGNYTNHKFNITSKNAKILKDEQWILSETVKNESESMLLTTGSSNENKSSNIYDLAGNIWEWTLEFTGEISHPCSRRGCGYKNNGYTHPASNRGAGNIDERFDSIGFRCVLY